ncbi:MAG: glycerophosphodiester phosphodiesterase [Prevotellaceae bacterium]|jgi:glycerophosphoryl diester phosphodiesterase|nr:glycerophosphodiester phosphodiesterase [Prevotellaceae bacterium]
MKVLKYTLLFILISNIDMHAQDIYRKFFLKNNVVAHRGAWKNKNIPQNSVESLREAFRIGCSGSEFDVRLTSDSVPVLCHDEHFSGKKVEYHCFKELSEIKLPNGETIPTLYRILSEGMKQSNTRLFLEIKSMSTKEKTLKNVEKTVEMVNKLGALPWVFYICFDYDAVKKVRELSPSAPVAYLNGDISPEQLAADKVTGLDYNRTVYSKNENFAQNAKNLGLSLNVWTVNSSEDMDSFINQEFDYITTDEPELLLGKNVSDLKNCYNE